MGARWRNGEIQMPRPGNRNVSRCPSTSSIATALPSTSQRSKRLRARIHTVETPTAVISSTALVICTPPDREVETVVSIGAEA